MKVKTKTPEILSIVTDGNVKEYSHIPIIGVYFLLKKDRVVYVGQSISIETRIKAHDRDFHYKFDSVYYIECNENDLRKIEKKYIEIFKPIGNGYYYPDSIYPLEIYTEEEHSQILKQMTGLQARRIKAACK